MDRHEPARQSAPPPRGNRLTRRLGKVVLRLMGWRIEGRLPDLPRFVAVGAPHTSNWDFVVVMASIFALGIDARWLAKHTLFRPPFGGLLRWLGGIPVDRGVRSGVVAQSVAAFRSQPRLILCVAPEGTRSGVREWKTGFYHIALGAGVPMVPCSLDFGRRVVGLGPPLTPTGDLDADMAALRAFYHGVRGRHRR